MRSLPTVVCGAVMMTAFSIGFMPSVDAWTTGPCTSADGVTVVIDFQELGGGIHVRCAPGPVESGFAALSRAGIDYQTTIRFPGFLCKIAGKPANDPCINASPATAYWSYWLASRGGVWCYSNWGAGNRTPPPGSVEGWSFSLNKTASTSPPPGITPPAPTPGIPPSELAGNDCDPRSSAPKATQPASPTTTRPRPSSTTEPATTSSKPRTASPTPGRSDDNGPTTRDTGPVAGTGTADNSVTNPGDDWWSTPDTPRSAEHGSDIARPSGEGDDPPDDVEFDVEVAGEDLSLTDQDDADGSDTATSRTESASGAQTDPNDLADGHGGSAVGVVVTFLLMVLMGTGTVLYRRRSD